MFGIRKKTGEPDEAQRFLDAVRDEPDQPDPREQDDRALTDIAAKDSRMHCDIVNIIVLSFVMLFFGTGFLTLTNYQDFSDDEPFSFQALVSGRYFSHIEKSFNDSIPLRDFLHNANEFAGFCFGLGNTPDYVKLSGFSDETYNIVDENGFIPIDDSRFDGGGDDPMQTYYGKEEDDIFSQSEDNGKNKKISGIIMATGGSGSSSSSGETTTTNNREPGATTTTTIPPETTTAAEPTTPTEDLPTSPPDPEPDESSDEPSELPED